METGKISDSQFLKYCVHYTLYITYKKHIYFRLNFSSKPYNGNEILPQVLMGGLAVAMMLKNQAKVA